MEAQPEALRLADALEQQFPLGTAQNYLDGEAAAELRRLHAVSTELLAACQAMLACCYDMERNDETLAAVKATMLAVAKATGELK